MNLRARRSALLALDGSWFPSAISESWRLSMNRQLELEFNLWLAPEHTEA